MTMVETTERTAMEGGPRSADGRRFEVFVREAESDPLRHVGTVAAPTPDVAHEEASKLFAWYARDVWICPAEETHRYSASSLANEDESGPEAADSNDDSAGDDSAGDDPTEPRVYEETEGTPTVACGGAPRENGAGDNGETDAGTGGNGATDDETDGTPDTNGSEADRQ